MGPTLKQIMSKCGTRSNNIFECDTQSNNVLNVTPNPQSKLHVQ